MSRPSVPLRGLLPLLFLAAIWSLPAEGQEAEPLILHFLDVGQGDAVLIKGPEGGAILYDGGPQRDRALDHLEALEVDELDLLVASHPHLDHIGGLPAVLGAYETRFVLDNGLIHTTEAYEHYLEAVRDSGAELLEPEERTITLGAAELGVLPPPGREAWGLNNNSVGLVVEYGEFRATLPGDAESAQWDWWLEKGHVPEGPVELHRASHHGSRNGDTQEGMERLRPETVVIGVGADNQYGHPHEEALGLYGAVKADIYRTDAHGTVTVTAWDDGTYEVEPEREVPMAAEGEIPNPAPDRCVDLNEASVDDLTEIIHVGEARAEQIVELRGERPFQSVEELTRVRGIGAVRAEEIIGEEVACVP